LFLLRHRLARLELTGLCCWVHSGLPVVLPRPQSRPMCHCGSGVFFHPARTLSNSYRALPIKDGKMPSTRALEETVRVYRHIRMQLQASRALLSPRARIEKLHTDSLLFIVLAMMRQKIEILDSLGHLGQARLAMLAQRGVLGEQDPEVETVAGDLVRVARQ